jgi:hypothetical protein
MNSIAALASVMIMTDTFQSSFGDCGGHDVFAPALARVMLSLQLLAIVMVITDAFPGLFAGLSCAFKLRLGTALAQAH